MNLFNEKSLQQTKTISDGTARMLTTLAGLGCNKHIIATFLEMDRAHPDHIRFLTGPVIQHRSQWMDTTPQWLYQAVITERLTIILDEHQRGTVGWKVGAAELTAVIYLTTMDAPMQTDMADLYLWASAQANAAHSGKSIAEFWDKFGGERIPDRWFESPSGRYAQLYGQMCRDIRKRVVKAAKVRAPGNRKKIAQNQIDDCEQIDLFA